MVMGICAVGRWCLVRGGNKLPLKCQYHVAPLAVSPTFRGAELAAGLHNESTAKKGPKIENIVTSNPDLLYFPSYLAARYSKVHIGGEQPSTPISSSSPLHPLVQSSLARRPTAETQHPRFQQQVATMDVAGLRDRIQSTLDPNQAIRQQAELDLKFVRAPAPVCT
jgi:hypothetical protein